MNKKMDIIEQNRLLIRHIEQDDDTGLAELIRRNLKAYRLDIPGTVYYDENLYHLSDYYNALPDKRVYYVLTDEDRRIAGGVGIAEFPDIEDCAELQKLYLDDSVKGLGLGYELMRKAEEAAASMGYGRIYLETHDNLDIAIHLYERCGYAEIDKPSFVNHGAMNRFFVREI